MKKGILLIALLALTAGISDAGIKVLVDFGPANDDDGRATSIPDINGNYWNSWRPTTGDTAIPNGTAFVGTVVDTDNNATGIGLTMPNSFNCNGIKHGGLLAPDAGLLGDFAIDTATEDYWFESTGGAAVTINGLDPELTYNLRMFGTRETTDTRITRYTVFDAAGSQYVDLQTSGAGIGTGGYNGNNDTIVGLSDLVPTAAGELTLDVSVVQGGFAYLGVLEVEAVPEPATFGLMSIMGVGLLFARRRFKR